MSLDLTPLLPPEDPATANARLARLAFALQLVGGIADLAHDLRSPLHGLSLAMTLLDEGAEKAEVRDSARRLMNSATERVEALLGSLDFPDFGEREARPQVLGDLVSRTLALWPLRPLTKRRPVAVELARDLPAVRSSDAALRIALLQLLLNACEAQPDPGAPPVALAAVSEGTAVVVTIRDHGPGFVGCSVEEAFAHGVSTRDRASHLGVGLGLARDLLAEIDASLEIGPATAGPGTVARVRLPAVGGVQA